MRSTPLAEILGADFAYLSTCFLATRESRVAEELKQMVVALGSEDVVCSASFKGGKANWLRQSIINYGIVPDNLPAGGIDLSRQDLKRWRGSIALRTSADDAPLRRVAEAQRTPRFR